jgi:hypothetical protein
MKAYWGSGGIAPRVLWPRHQMEVSCSFTPRPLYPRERASGTLWIGGWVGPRAVLDAVVKINIPSPCQESNPIILIVQPIEFLKFSGGSYIIYCIFSSPNEITTMCFSLYHRHRLSPSLHQDPEHLVSYLTQFTLMILFTFQIICILGLPYNRFILIM